MPRFRGDNLRPNLTLVEKLKELAAVEKCTPAQLALAWVLSRAPYVVPIPGTSHRRWIEENAAAASLRISADTEDALLQVFRAEEFIVGVGGLPAGRAEYFSTGDRCRDRALSWPWSRPR
jgi:aryl-alcohol dehydrogenase-like predicted oxidoreductase